MSAALLDLNVLVALFDPAHPHHEDAHRWFSSRRKRGWATCPVTVNGCVRVLSNPGYPSVETTPAEVISRLRILCSAPDHEFWAEGLSLLDERRFRRQFVVGHLQVTDIYLLGLAVHYKGRLATFDRSIPLKPVNGATAAHVELIGHSGGKPVLHPP